MNSLNNSVRLTGWLGAKPEVQLTPGENKVAKISLATDYYKKNNKEEMVRETHWHQLILWNKQADLAEQFLNKGSRIAVEGRLSNRFYTDKDGARHYLTEVVVNEIMFLDKRHEQ